MTGHATRVELFADYRPALARLLREARGTMTAMLSAYLLSLREPTGFLIALGLQQRIPGIQPERMLRVSLAAGDHVSILTGVMTRSMLIDVLAPLSPATRALATELRRPAPGGAPRVVVAAAGGSEVFTLGEPGPLDR